MGLFSGSKKTTTSVDPWTQGAQRANYTGAMGLTPNYTPTSQAQVQSYFNPYEDSAIKSTLGDLDYQRQLAIHQGGDQATSQHAFGGSRQGVADALTNEAFARQGGLISSQMRDQGYWGALSAAQGENQYGFQYPLARQQLLNGTLAGVTPTTTTKTSDSMGGLNAFGGLLGGAGDILKFFQKKA